jgi:hypothetical protein
MIKGIFKKIPFLGSFAGRLLRSMSSRNDFTSSAEYWEHRYRKGGNSGSGSYNKLAEFKAEVLNQFVTDHTIGTVIEFGSGDGNQLKYFHFKSYTGFDISHTAVSACREIYKADPTKRFSTLDDYNGETAELVLSLDVIYHLVEDRVFEGYMQKLFAASEKYVIIYSSDDDDHENNKISPHVRHRKFSSWVEKHAIEFRLIQHIPNKYPFNGMNEVSSYADFYIFRKENQGCPVAP